MTTVETAARLHFGFGNLSLAHERLYGGIGVAVDAPGLSVTAEPAGKVTAPPVVAEYADRVCDLLDLPGATVSVGERLPRHVGFGSGTQFALATATAVAGAYDESVDPRSIAPALGRGGRSGIGVGAFERGGFLFDAGHPTSRFTTDRPADGEWSVPDVVVRHPLPGDWRFVLVVPDAEPGRNGEDEDRSMREVVETADPAIADEISGIVTRRLLPAVTAGRREAFGAAVGDVGRLNGAWYADAQGGVFRPPVGTIVERLREIPVVSGVGQSSWGPAVYGLTDAGHAEEARSGAREALDAAGVDGDVLIAGVRNRGATVDGRAFDADCDGDR